MKYIITKIQNFDTSKTSTRVYTAKSLSYNHTRIITRHDGRTYKLGDVIDINMEKKYENQVVL